jgi:sugar phosphate permease
MLFFLLQMLIGLCGAELISPKSVGASQGILGLISYMGAAAAGIPLSFMQVGLTKQVL